MNTKRDEKIKEIAKKYLSIMTLETRHSDLLDFHDNIAVWSLKIALEKAYEAGQESNNK